MLLPFELPSRWSIYALFAQKPSAAVAQRLITRRAGENAAVQTFPMQTTSSINGFAIAWLIGMSVCALVFLLAWLRSMRRFREAEPVQSEAVKAFLSAHPLRRRVRVRFCRPVSSPLTYGLLRPVILLAVLLVLTTAVAFATSAPDNDVNPYAEYEPFGLTVENDALYFEGQRVRTFTDTYKVDFFRTVSCEHYDEEGSIDVIAIRDGPTLTGLEVIK